MQQFYGFATLIVKQPMVFFNKKLARCATILRIRDIDNQNHIVFNQRMVRCATVLRIRNTDYQFYIYIYNDSGPAFLEYFGRTDPSSNDSGRGSAEYFGRTDPSSNDSGRGS